MIFSREYKVRDLARVGRAWLPAIVLAALVVTGTAVLSALDGPRADRPTLVTMRADGIRLNQAQRKAVGIVVNPLTAKSLPPVLRAPGEVRANDYITRIISPRITATIVQRHAKLGDKVSKDDRLVTLYSRDMAEAQSGFVLAERDLARSRELKSRGVIAGQQYDQAIAKRQELHGRLESFGLTPVQIASLTGKGLANSKIGQFDLLAPDGGTITKDDFREGDVAEPGKRLFEITDPKNVWVEAHVSPPLARTIEGEDALVLSGTETRKARIIQVGDTVDETTRTVVVRLAMETSDGGPKAGQFVDVELFGAKRPVLAVPTAAVLRDADGQWFVYVEASDGSFRAKQVAVGYTVGDQTVIDGIPAGTRVVVAGAFFIRSEAAKASFGSDTD